MKRIKKDRPSILLDTYDKNIEFSKYTIAHSWLIFLKNYEKELYSLKYEEIIKCSFQDNQMKYYSEWINLILDGIDKSKLTYVILVDKLEKRISDIKNYLGIPKDKDYFSIEIVRGKIIEETGLVETYRKIYI